MKIDQCKPCFSETIETFILVAFATKAGRWHYLLMPFWNSIAGATSAKFIFDNDA